VKAVPDTGKKTLIMAGVWTRVCVMFPALDATTTLARFVQGGVVPTTANAVICEIHRTWNRPEAAELAQLYTMVAPNYRAVMESYQMAQQAAKAPAR
jgi:nicotinamidase-related amidase